MSKSHFLARIFPKDKRDLKYDICKLNLTNPSRRIQFLRFNEFWFFFFTKSNCTYLFEQNICARPNGHFVSIPAKKEWEV